MIDTQHDGNISSLNKFNDFFNSNFPGNNINSQRVPQIENTSQEGGLTHYNPYNKPAYKMVKPRDEINKSNIGYYISIDMELHPGLTLTPEELKESQCRQKWNAVRKAYAGFRGQPYVIPPVYQTNKTNKTLKNKEEQNNNKTRAQKGGLSKINKTRKHELYGFDRRKKTLKNY